jgi:hypothetical protein
MPRVYEILGLLLVATSTVFFYYSVEFFAGRDYIAGVLEIFVGFALIRAGLDLTKLALLRKENGL